MRIILQDQFKLLKEGKLGNDAFIKQARLLHPTLIKNSANIEETTNILKKNNIIFENFVGLTPISDFSSRPKESWEIAHEKFLKEINEKDQSIKVEQKKTTKEVENQAIKGFDFKDKSNPQNISNQQFITGMYAEYNDEKNKDKTYDQLADIVVKNLTKDQLYYVKNGQFGIKGLGYEEGNASKTDKMEPVKNPDLTANITKSNTKDVTDKMPKSKVKDEMTMTPKSSKGVQKMTLPGKEKIIKLDENISFSSLLENEEFTTPKYFDDLEQAKSFAQTLSADEGVAVHINQTRGGGYVVEDWFDSDNTLYSYASGMPLEETENPTKYIVYREGGSIGEKKYEEEFNDELEAKDHAKKLNSQLSPGEKSYYKIKYKVKKSTNENISYDDLKEETFEIKDGIDEKINDLIQNKLFMREMVIDDLTPEEAYQFMKDSFNEEDIIEFHKEVFGTPDYPESDLNESSIKTGDIIPLKYHEDFDYPAGDYEVFFTPENEEEEEFGLLDPTGRERWFPLWFLKQNAPGKFNIYPKTQSNLPDFTITGDADGEPYIFEGEDLLDILNQMGEISNDSADFINKVEYYVTNSNSLSGEDKIKLDNWFEASKYNNLNESSVKSRVIIDQGYNSYIDGKSLTDNPYDEYYESIEHKYWKQGWEQAKVEESYPINSNSQSNIMENKDIYQNFKQFLLTENKDYPKIGTRVIINPELTTDPIKKQGELGIVRAHGNGYSEIEFQDGKKGKYQWGTFYDINSDNSYSISLQESKKRVPVSKKITEIEKQAATLALETKIKSIDEEIARRNNQIKMIDENEELSELVDKSRIKELQKEIKLFEKQKDKYIKLQEKATGKKKQEVVTDSKSDAAEEDAIEEATKDDVDNQKKLNAELANTKKAADELNKASQESGLLEQEQPSEEELSKMKDELESNIDMVSNFEEAVELYLHSHPEHEKYKMTLRQLAEPMF